MNGIEEVLSGGVKYDDIRLLKTKNMSAIYLYKETGGTEEAFLGFLLVPTPAWRGLSFTQHISLEDGIVKSGGASAQNEFVACSVEGVVNWAHNRR